MLTILQWRPVFLKGWNPCNGKWDLHNVASQLLPEFSSGLGYSVPATLTSFQSWLCQDLNLEAFCWLFPLPGLLFSQIKLTSPYLLQSLLKYPLTNDAYHDDPFCDCHSPHPLYIHLHFLKSCFLSNNMQNKLCIYCLFFKHYFHLLDYKYYVGQNLCFVHCHILKILE